MVLEHVVLHQCERKKISVIKSGEVSRKLCGIAGAGKAPVAVIGVATLEAADQQIIHAGPVKDPEAMYKRRFTERLHTPVIFPIPCHDYNPGLRGIVGTVEFIM